VRNGHAPALVGPGVTATRADDEDSGAGNGVRNKVYVRNGYA
jgi:hypothetical protein